MNFRKPIIYSLLHLSGSKIPQYLKEMKEYEHFTADQIKQRTNEKLKKILLHAYNNVPYYQKILPESGVIENGKVNLENFTNIPLLTKDIIQDKGENLYSKDYQTRKPYENSSGGSTGAPARFLQDANYDQWNIATKLYFNIILGKDPGDPEIKFWGSDRDIIKGNLTLKDRLLNFLYNRKFFNSYRLGRENIKQLIELNNRHKPVAYWSYMESALELAVYLSQHQPYFHSPKFVISTIGPLTEDVKNKIESGMQCKVYNQYGSREVGAIACQCEQQKSLHTFSWWNHIEVVDQSGRPIAKGQGNIIVTTLENFSMPLIRYEIGDVALADQTPCPCGRKTFMLQKVIGRTLGYFKKKDGSLLHSHFLVQVMSFKDWLKRYQIIQDDFDHLLIRIQLAENKTPPPDDIDNIVSKSKLLMGDDCNIDFEFVDEIERTSSGKFLYTICKV